MTPTDVAVDALAVHRLVHLLQHDEVWPVYELRRAYLKAVGNTRWADLATCPWCLSVHLGALAALARWRYPRTWSVLARVLASSAVAGHLAQR